MDVRTPRNALLSILCKLNDLKKYDVLQIVSFNGSLEGDKNSWYSSLDGTESEKLAISNNLYCTASLFGLSENTHSFRLQILVMFRNRKWFNTHIIVSCLNPIYVSRRNWRDCITIPNEVRMVDMNDKNVYKKEWYDSVSVNEIDSASVVKEMIDVGSNVKYLILMM